MRHVYRMVGVVLVALVAGCTESESGNPESDAVGSSEGNGNGAATAEPDVADTADAQTAAPAQSNPTSEAAAAPAPPVKATKLVQVEATISEPPLLFESSYKVKQLDGVEWTEFEIEVNGARPEEEFAVSADGFDLGTILADPFGEAELEFANDPAGEKGEPYPEGFPEIKAGTVIKIGDRELTLVDVLNAEAE